MKRKKIIVLTIVILLFSIVYVPISFGANDFDFSQDAGEIVGEGIVWLLTLVPKYIALIVTMSIRGILGYIADIGSTANHIDVTAFDFIANKIPLTDVNFFKTTGNTDILISIKQNVASWYNVLRGVAAGALMCTLLYLAIKTITSQSSSDKASYKHMLTTWVTSIVLLFVLHYVMVLIISLSEVLTQMFVGSSNVESDFSELVNQLWSDAKYPSFNGLASAIAFCLMIYISAVFAVLYINRMIKVGFLILISPIVVISYSLDKQSGKSPSLDKWFKEFTYTVVIQPFHALLFSVFAGLAVDIIKGGASSSGFLQGNCLAGSILLYFILTFIWKAEKLIRQIFFGGGGIDPSESVSFVKKFYAGYGKVLKTGKKFIKDVHDDRKGKKKSPAPTSGGGTPPPAPGGGTPPPPPPGGSSTGGTGGYSTSTTSSSTTGSRASSTTGTASQNSSGGSNLSSAAQNILNNNNSNGSGNSVKKATLEALDKIVDSSIDGALGFATGDVDKVLDSMNANLGATLGLPVNIIKGHIKIKEEAEQARIEAEEAMRKAEQARIEAEKAKTEAEEMMRKSEEIQNNVAEQLSDFEKFVSQIANEDSNLGIAKLEIPKSEIERIIKDIQNNVNIDDIIEKISLNGETTIESDSGLSKIRNEKFEYKLNEDMKDILKTGLSEFAKEINDQNGSFVGKDPSSIANEIHARMLEGKNNS